MDQELSKHLKASFAVYQASLNLKSKRGLGAVTTENYDTYLLQYYVIPSASKYLRALTDEERKDHLARNPWITWTNGRAAFAFADFVAHYPSSAETTAIVPNTGGSAMALLTATLR